MKGFLHPKNDVTINPSGNPSIRDLIAEAATTRRTFLGAVAGSTALASVGALSGLLPSIAYAVPIAPVNGFGGIGFESIPAKTRLGPLLGVADTVDVPPGYTVEVLCAWGQPIVAGGPDWNPDATQTAADQEKQMGMHCDGMHYFAFPARGGPSSDRGIFCCNNEYTEETLLFGAEGPLPTTIDKVRKSQAAHGVSIFEVRKGFGPGASKWGVVRNSAYGRRVTANTPVRVSGPAAGHELLRSKKFDIQPTGSTHIGTNDGFTANGTINNCANGYTPWGTYLTCEENWNGFFARGANAFPPEYADIAAEIIADFNRYGVAPAAFGVTWPEVDPRFNAETNPLESNLFGWVVEIDPFDPSSTPVKRTALGRTKHESAQVALSSDELGTPNRVAYYLGDDERNEYIYKFVAAGSFDPSNRAANRDLLDTGTLYVARLTDTPVVGKPNTFRGQWVPLLPDTLSVIPSNNTGTTFYRLRELKTFTGAAANGIVELDDAKVLARILVHTRQAADAVGATMMDRPEWTAVRTYNDGYGYGGAGYGYNDLHPLEIYCTLTNNNRRGGGGAISVNAADGSTTAGAARPPVDVANPRPDNDFGHIIRWREDGNYVTATGFEWDIFVLAGDTITTKTLTTTGGSAYLPANLVPGSGGTGPVYEGDIVDVPNGSADFGAPDGLWFDQFGRMWIETDQPGDGEGDFVNIGACSMLCADPNTKEVRRFLNGPNACEITGVINTPDGRTMFVGVQHPGEGATVDNPTRFSHWPQSQYATNSAGEHLAVVAGVPQPQGVGIRPRSSVLVITRTDGGVIGA